MYSLTFHFSVTTPPQCGRKGTAHAAGASIFSLARGVVALHAVGLADYRWALPRISIVTIATQPVHQLQIRPIVHNWGASPTTPPSYIRVRAIVWACGCGQTRRQTHRQTHTDVRDHNCATVCSFHFSFHSFLVFNARVSVTDEVGQSPGFPYFSLAVRFRRLSPLEPINLTDVFSVRRYAARRPSPLILSVF